jgi:hypothetical protein
VVAVVDDELVGRVAALAVERADDAVVDVGPLVGGRGLGVEAALAIPSESAGARPKRTCSETPLAGACAGEAGALQSAQKGALERSSGVTGGVMILISVFDSPTSDESAGPRGSKPP